MRIEIIHPMLVHFPIVLAIVALGLDFWAIRNRRKGTSSQFGRHAGTVVMTAAALMAVAAFIFGDIAFDTAISKGISEALLESHEGWGTMTTIALIAFAIVRIALWWRGLGEARAVAWLGLATSATATVMVLITAGFGGYLVYDLGINVAHAAVALR